MKTAASSAIEKESLSHNLQGQRLGRKGRDTRERILLAAETLLAAPPGAPITLSAVAREASLGMTTLYLYFSDFTELLLAVLDGIMATAEDSYIGRLRERWPDEALGEHAFDFVESYYAFWLKHSRALHLRNAIAFENEARMRAHRIAAAQPLIELLMRQMDGDSSDQRPQARSMATVLFTGIERMITVVTDAVFPTLVGDDPAPHVRGFLRAEARLLELAIADTRAAARCSTLDPPDACSAAG